MQSNLRYLSGARRRIVPSAALALGVWALPSLALAQDEAPSIVKYGLDGFWTGATVGLAAGYIATGNDYESREWRKLVFGAGVGALAGVGVGITLGISDVGDPPPRAGWLVLRDTRLGTGLGAVVGTAVGALFIIDSGDLKDLVVGASWGTVIGAAAGAAFGVIEASAGGDEPRTVADSAAPVVRFTLVGSEGSWLPMPGVYGEF
jgi:hypothetical protein